MTRPRWTATRAPWTRRLSRLAFVVQLIVAVVAGGYARPATELARPTSAPDALVAATARFTQVALRAGHASADVPHARPSDRDARGASGDADGVRRGFPLALGGAQATVALPTPGFVELPRERAGSVAGPRARLSPVSARGPPLRA